MAQHITTFSIVEVAKPNIGESWPARVRADVTVNLNVKDHIKNEWEGNCFISPGLLILSLPFVVLTIKCFVSMSKFVFNSSFFPHRAAKAWCLLSDHGEAQPGVRHTLRPAPAFLRADRCGVRERLRGAGYARWKRTRHWRRYACVNPAYTHMHRTFILLLDSQELVRLVLSQGDQGRPDLLTEPFH